MEPSGSDIPFSVETAPYADTHPESGSLFPGLVSQQTLAFSEANTRNSFEDIWGLFARSSVGQPVSCVQSGDIGASAGIHPTIHVPGSVKPNMDWLGERRGEVVLSIREMNRAE